VWLGTLLASNIDILNTLHGDVINIYSSSSYKLSLFSSKAGSAHDTSGGVALAGSWSTSIDDHWPGGSATGENVRGKV
jgi:hypothetical protein